MTLDRRTVLGLGAGGLAATGLPAGAAAFGLAPGDGDQTAALQAALDACATAGETLVLPAGRFRARPLRAPGGCRIAGADGTLLQAIGGGPLLEAAGVLVLRRLMLHGDPEQTGGARGAGLVAAGPAAIDIEGCTFAGTKGDALALRDCHGFVRGTAFTEIGGRGLVALSARGLTISHCRAGRIGQAVLHVESVDEAIIAGNACSRCATGIVAKGPSILSGNAVTQAAFAGLLLGDAAGSATVSAQGNLLRACRIGIGIAPSGDYIVAAMNTIVAAKDGAIRAVDGARLLGPDLAQASTEAFLNLTAFANVVR